MSVIDGIVSWLPEVEKPKEKKLSFKTKLQWTLGILVAFFILSLMPVFGIEPAAAEQFKFLELVLGASIGSIITLGIGPIVTSSIVLQLLNGAGILKFDLTKPEGKARFQGVQKIGSIFFIILEAFIYVLMGGLQPQAGIPAFVIIFQLFLGGIMIMLMDDVINKWGFGSGISLFIAAGVSKQIFVQLLNPFKQPGGDYSVGLIWQVFQALKLGVPRDMMFALLTILATIAVFLVVVYTQAMKVEIPLSFGRVRGHGIRWPLNFFYTSNIPVILIAALIANVQLVATLISGSRNSPLMAWFRAPNIIDILVGNANFTWLVLLQALTYALIFVVGSVIFGIFWVQTAGLDARSQAKQIMASGLQIPGFRKDPRVLESILNRYIWPLTIMGSIAVGLLASVADLSGALGSGTGILLTVMIVYRLYEEIAQQHLMDMNPIMRKFVAR